MAFDLVSVGLVCADVMVRPVEALPERGKLRLVPHLELHLGGLAGVAAAVFSQLGGRAAFVGAIGEDGFGDYLIHMLESQGVNVSAVRRVPGLGTAATVVLVSGDGERSFLHRPGASVALSEADMDFDFLRQARHIHWGGPAVTPGLDGEPMGRVLAKARSLGLTTSMDTCYDGEGQWLSRIEDALPHLDIVMSSLEEARQYTNRHEPEAIADFYRSYGVNIVMVKLGAEGIFVKDAAIAQRIPAHKVNVMDTTGAGDAACGGFLYGWLRGWDVSRCARLANAIGALTVQTMGGAEAIRSLQQVTAFLEGA